MKHTSVASSRSNAWKGILGAFVLFCLFAISACGGNKYTTRVYDNAHVLNTSKVQRAANTMSSNVDIYTTKTFNGTPYDFQRAVTAKLGNDPNKVVMGIDTVHHYVHVAKGTNVPMNSAAVSQIRNSFVANSGNGDYTRATTAALSTMNRALPANNDRGGSGGLWTIPLGLLALLVVLLLAFKPRRRVGYSQSGYQPPQPTYRPPQTNYPPTQEYQGRDVAPPTAGDASDYRRGMPRNERQADLSDKDGEGGTFSRGSDFGGTEHDGGGTYGNGGNDFEKGKPGRGNN